MPDNDEFKIQLRVADKVLPTFCKRSEEGIFRKAATALNDKMLQYSSQFAGTEFGASDLLALAAVHISAQNLLLKQKEDKSPILERIKILDKELEEYLQKVQTN